MIQYHDTIWMVNFINPPSTISIVVNLYALYRAPYKWYGWQDRVTDRESKFTIREPRAMAVGVPFKMMSNGTTGTIGKILLLIVKLRLPSLNYVQIVAKVDILMRIEGYIIYLYSLKRLANNIKIYIIYIMR